MTVFGDAPQERPRDPVRRSSGLQPPVLDGGQRRRHHHHRCGAVDTAPSRPRRTVAASSRAVTYDCVDDDPTTTDWTTPAPRRCRTARWRASRAGPTYSILTTGNAALADDPTRRAATGDGWNVPATRDGRGRLRLTRPPRRPAGREHRVDLRGVRLPLLSDEYPEYVSTNFNDAFIAQLDTLAVAVDPTTRDRHGTRQLRGRRRRRDLGRRVGPSAMVDAETGVGTIYDGATPLLTARVPVAAGSAQLAVPDDLRPGRLDLDSAAFVDNLRFETDRRHEVQVARRRPGREPIGVSPVPGNPPTLSKDKSTLSFPVAATCRRLRSRARDRSAGFIPTPGRNVAAAGRRDARRRTPLAAGSATIAPTPRA